MSVATPTEYESRTRPARRRRRALIRVLGVVIALAVLAGLGLAAWRFMMQSPVTTTTATKCPAPPTDSRALPPGVVPPNKITVNVYNATTRVGLATKVADELRDRGFKIESTKNDPQNKNVADVAELRAGPKGKAAATTVLAHLGAGKVVTDKRKGTTVDVVLGARYRALRTPQQALTALVPPPPGC